MTLDEVAVRTGRNVALLRRWAREGKIPVTKVGRIYLVAESDLWAIEWASRTPGRQANMAEGHYDRMRASARRLLISPVESGGMGYPVQLADKRLDAWDAEAASRGDDRERLDYWKDGLRWIQEQRKP